jgi:hypothetical protein
MLSVYFQLFASMSAGQYLDSLHRSAKITDLLLYKNSVILSILFHIFEQFYNLSALLPFIAFGICRLNKPATVCNRAALIGRLTIESPFHRSSRIASKTTLNFRSHFCSICSSFQTRSLCVATMSRSLIRARTTWMLVRTAMELFSTLATITAPCSVKAYGAT